MSKHEADTPVTHDDFMEMLKQQSKLIEVLQQKLALNETKIQVTPNNVPWPTPFEVHRGDLLENFDHFQKGWYDYAAATGMNEWRPEEERKKVHTLFTAIGNDALIKFNRFGLKEEDMVNVQMVLDAIKLKLQGTKNTIYERAIFNTCVQQDDEPFNVYLARLEKLVESCEYRDLKDEFLRDRIVVGINNKNVQKTMMRKPLLTLAEAIDICKTEEMTGSRLKNMNAPEDREVNKIARNKSKVRKCRFCGFMHKFTKGECKAWGKECTACGGRNHLATVCRKSNPPKRKERNQVREVEESTDSEEEQQICVIKKKKDANKKLVMNIEVKPESKWITIPCELDTGADVCLIGYNNLKQLMKEEPKILKTSTKLRGFGGNDIQTKGYVDLRCRSKQGKYKLLCYVVDIDHVLLLSKQACFALGYIKLCKKIDGESNAETIIQKYEDVFEGMGKLEGKYEFEIDKEIKPTIQTPRRIPIGLREELKHELESMVAQGVITPVQEHTEWVHNMVLIKKKGKLRICIDPIKLNSALKRPHFQFTTLEEILPDLKDAKVFSTVDLKKGFWHIELTEESSKLTTFWTPYGRYRWIRLPFGVTPAPEIFQQRIQQILQGLHGVKVLADDILVFGSGKDKTTAMKDHNNNLEELLKRLSQHNCKLNKEKMKLGLSEITFFGHIISDQGVRADPQKVAAILKYPTPRNKQELLRFIGMFTYLSKFIKDSSSELYCLRQLIKENTDWNWGTEEEEEFQRVKAVLLKVKTLKFYKPDEEIVMECDASPFGLGAVVYQGNEVIGYASKALTDAQRNYSQIEKELAAIVFAYKKFEQILAANRKVSIKTDHKPLVNIFKKPMTEIPKRLQRLLLNLPRHNLQLEFINGKSNIVADALSRAPLVEQDAELIYKIERLNRNKQLAISSERLREIEAETAKDQTLSKIKDYIRDGWPDFHKLNKEEKAIYNAKSELSVHNTLLYKSDKLIIPKLLRPKMLSLLHKSHSGIEATLRLARQNIFWPNMSTDISNEVLQCTACQTFKPNQLNPPMQSHDSPELPFQYVSLDVMQISQNGKLRNYLITVDHYSDFIEVDLLRDLTPGSTINACMKNFSRFGIPTRLCTDNGTNFKSNEFKDFAERWDIEHSTSSPNHQQGNGKAESAVKVVKNLFKKTEFKGENFYLALLHQRNTPNKSGYSPSQKLLSRTSRSLIPATMQGLMPKIPKNVKIDIDRRKGQAKKYYDSKTKEYKPIESSADVWIKHKDKWVQGKNIRQFPGSSHEVMMNGKTYRKSRVHVRSFITAHGIQPEPRKNIQPRSKSTRTKKTPSYLKDYIMPRKQSHA